MYAIMFVSIIVFPIVYLLNLDPSVQQLISSIGFAVGTLSAISVIFGPKSWLLLQGAELDSKLGIVMPGGKKKSGFGDKVSATDPVEVPLLDTNVNMVFTKRNAEENSKMCREQIIKWQRMLLHVENNVLISTTTNHQTSETNRPPSSSHLGGAALYPEVEVGQDAHQDMATVTEERDHIQTIA